MMGFRAAVDSKALGPLEVPPSPKLAGGLLRTSTRPTLNRRTEAARLYEHSPHRRCKSCSDLGRVLVLNDPADWT